MFEIVCDVPDDGDAHDKYLELYVLNLSIKFFLGCPFQYFTHFSLSLLLLGHLRQFVFLLSLNLSALDAFSHLPRYLLVAIVNNLNQKITALINGCTVEHKSLQNIANDRFMINGKIQFERVGRLSQTSYPCQNLFLPCGSHDEIIDKHFILILRDALLQDVLIILHERIDVQLHIQSLQTLILLKPNSTCVVFYIYLTNLTDELLYLFVVEDVAQPGLHFII